MILTSHFLTRLRRRGVLFGCIICGPALVLAGEVKVDINRDSKNTAAETETGYTKWSADTTGGAATGTDAVTKTFTSATAENITVSFAQTAASQSRGGTGLLSNWYQTGAQGTAKIVSDGLTVAPANLTTGGEIQMTITGLSAGPHTLLTYHNAWDASASLVSLAPIDISVNGVPAITGLQPTIRAATNTAAPIAYLEFVVAGPSTVTTILFTAQTSSGATTKNVMINGFEIDTPNATRIANTPSPADADEHVDADSGSAVLSWSADLAGNAVSHDVYLGTSKTAVQAATRASAEFKGNQAGLTYTATGLNGSLTYYWRIDEIDSSGNPTKGTVWMFRPRQLAFPGAEGYGRFARGGRGGKVVHVTSIADYTSSDTPVPGTLRYAIEQVTGPRTIVFDVAGLITLESRLTINSPYITIAGQTAPGKGITVCKYTIGLSGAKDVIVRHFRSRPGNISGTTIDGMGMQGSDHSIMDHCSISWSLDEAFSSRSAKNITLQRTLISEALNAAGHQNYPPGTEHGYAASIGGDKGSFHHNLLAHCYGRNWSLAGGLDAAGFFAGRLDITNNVVYNWGSRSTDGGAHEVNFVNNYYKPGAGTTYFYALNAQYDNFPGTQRYFFSGNVMPGRFDEATQTSGRTMTASSGSSLPSYENFLSAAFFPSYVTTQSAGDAYKRVLSDVGCNQPLIDDHDVRMITETLAGTYTYSGSATGKPGFPDTQADVGGWESYPTVLRVANYDSDGDGMPDWWENAKGLNPNSTAGDFTEANIDPTGGGFTNLEIFLNWMAAPHLDCVQNSLVTLDLSQLARGYTSGPEFAVSGALNGTVALAGDGKTATFTPTAGFIGLAAYNFTVTDSAGSTMSGSVNLRVLAASDSAPAITAQPPSQTVIAGNSVAFTAAASGTPAPTYQWRKNAVAISGATSSSYTIASVAAGDAGSYTVVATNSVGSATSNVALLSVIVAPFNAVITITVE